MEKIKLLLENKTITIEDIISYLKNNDYSVNKDIVFEDTKPPYKYIFDYEEEDVRHHNAEIMYKLGYKCGCGGVLIPRLGSSYFLGCSCYPRCKNTKSLNTRQKEYLMKWNGTLCKNKSNEMALFKLKIN